MEITLKDRQRILDIQRNHSFRGNGLSLATKMTKLIRDPEKAERRWLASVELLGSDHFITQIFLERKLELQKEPFKEKAPREKIQKAEKVDNGIVRLPRFQKDFPLGCKVKFNEEVGTVESYEEDQEFLVALFPSGRARVNLYNLKRF